MPTNIVDLDAVVSPDRSVKTGGKTYKVPPSPPMEYFLWMSSFIQRSQEGMTNDDLTGCHEQTYALLAMRREGVDFSVCLALVRADLKAEVEAAERGEPYVPKIERIGMTAEQCVTFFRLVYLTDELEDEEERPTRTRGGTGSSRATKARSRS